MFGFITDIQNITLIVGASNRTIYKLSGAGVAFLYEFPKIFNGKDVDEWFGSSVSNDGEYFVD